MEINYTIGEIFRGGLLKNTTNRNFMKELRRQGFVPANYVDDKTGVIYYFFNQTG